MGRPRFTGELQKSYKYSASQSILPHNQTTLKILSTLATTSSILLKMAVLTDDFTTLRVSVTWEWYDSLK